MDLKALKHACGPQLDAAWDICLRELAEASTPAQLEDALAWVCTQRDEFLQACDEITDPDDLSQTVAMMFIESKSTWIMYNTTVGYQYLSRGAAHPMTVLRASLTSQFITVLEPLLTPQAFEEITEFLAAPSPTA